MAVIRVRTGLTTGKFLEAELRKLLPLKLKGLLGRPFRRIRQQAQRLQAAFLGAFHFGKRAEVQNARRFFDRRRFRRSLARRRLSGRRSGLGEQRERYRDESQADGPGWNSHLIVPSWSDCACNWR